MTLDEQDDAVERLRQPSADFAAEARELHAIMGAYDWYDMAGTYAERLLHERCVRLISCAEFGAKAALF